jgi:hypothetical protein
MRAHIKALEKLLRQRLINNPVVNVQTDGTGAVMIVTMSNMFDLDAPPAGAVWVAAMLVFAVVVIPVLFFIFA